MPCRTSSVTTGSPSAGSMTTVPSRATFDQTSWREVAGRMTRAYPRASAAEVAALAISAKYANSVKVKGSSPYVVTVRPMSPDLPVRSVRAAAEGR